MCWGSLQIRSHLLCIDNYYVSSLSTYGLHVLVHFLARRTAVRGTHHARRTAVQGSDNANTRPKKHKRCTPRAEDPQRDVSYCSLVFGLNAAAAVLLRPELRVGDGAGTLASGAVRDARARGFDGGVFGGGGGGGGGCSTPFSSMPTQRPCMCASCTRLTPRFFAGGSSCTSGLVNIG